MKNITTSLYAICTFGNSNYYTEGKEYPVFKIRNGHYGQEITIVDDRGCLVEDRAKAFKFITK